MRYFVLGPNGERYGPADLPTLNEWAASNRVFPHSKLMEEMSGTVVVASTLQGLNFALAPAPVNPGPMQPPAPGTVYQPMAPSQPMARPGMPYSARPVDGGDGTKDAWSAVGIAVIAPIVGFFLIYGAILAIGGVQFGWKAYQKGTRWGIVGIVLNIIAIFVALYARFVLRPHMMGYDRY